MTEEQPTLLPGSIPGDGGLSDEEPGFAVMVMPQGLTMPQGLAESPAPRKAPPPPAAYAPPPWLAPPSVDPPYETPAAPPSPSSPKSVSMGVGKGHITLSKLQEFLAVHRGLKSSCQTLPLTFALWLSFVLLTSTHGHAEEAFKNAELLRVAVEGARAPGSAVGALRDLTLHSISEIEQVLPWVEGALVPVLSSGGQGFGEVRGRQQVLGWARMTQTRGVNGTCEELGDTMRMFVMIMQDSQSSATCHEKSSVAQAYGPHFTDFAFRPEPEGSNRFEAWLELGRSMQSVQQRAAFLQQHRWLDSNTQDISIEAIFLNSEAYVFSHLQITFTLHREGLLQVDLQVQPLRGNIYPHWTYAILDALWILVLLLVLYRAIANLCRTKRRGLLSLYWEDPYVYLEWIGTFVGFALVCVYWVQVSHLEAMESTFVNVGSMPKIAANEAPANLQVQATLENRRYELRLAHLFSDFASLSTMIEYHRLCSFIYIVLIVARYVKGFAGQPRLALLVSTLLSFADFFIHYCIIFVVVFGNFALAGYVLFGEQLQGWSTLPSAGSHLFAVLFGEFDYNDFHSVAPLTAAAWFLCFYGAVVLLLMGTLSAAVLDVYVGIREQLGEPGASISKQIFDYLAEVWWVRTYEGSQKALPDSLLHELIMSGSDPIAMERLGRLMLDCRLSASRESLTGKVEAEDVIVDTAYLSQRGCDPLTAERLLEQCEVWCQHAQPSNTPVQRLMVLVASQISHIRSEALRMRKKMRSRNDKAVRTVDRLDLKHAKCAALARRIRKAQELPPGWTALVDEHGRRYLRQEATGLTSWTLPRNLF